MNFYAILATTFLIIGIRAQYHDLRWVSGASLGASVWLIVCAAKKECDK